MQAMHQRRFAAQSQKPGFLLRLLVTSQRFFIETKVDLRNVGKPKARKFKQIKSMQKSITKSAQILVTGAVLSVAIVTLDKETGFLASTCVSSI